MENLDFAKIDMELFSYSTRDMEPNSQLKSSEDWIKWSSFIFKYGKININ